MTKSEYRDYIQGADWQKRRRQFLFDNPQCVRCHLPRWVARLLYDQELNIHHLNYSTLGNETSEDVEALCRRCHEIETFGRSNFAAVPSHECIDCPVDGVVFDPYVDRCDACLCEHQEIMSYHRGYDFGLDAGRKASELSSKGSDGKVFEIDRLGQVPAL